MEQAIAGLVTRYETGTMSRRELIAALAGLVGVASGAAAQTTAPTFKAEGVNHVSYQVSNVARTRDFYVSVLGMRLDSETPTQANLFAGDVQLIIRSAPTGVTRPRVDHIAYTIPNWDTDRVKADLIRRGLTPRLDLGTLPRGTGSFHVRDPEGYDVQVAGTLNPGDSLLRRTR